MANENPLEIKAETDFVVEAAESYGVLAIKCQIPGRRNWPDRQILCGNGYSFFIEFKRIGEPPRRGQLFRHRKLRERGYSVYVCETLEQALYALEGELLLL